MNPQTEAPCVYVYDIAEGTMVKGVEIEPGYIFTRINYMED